MDMLELLHNNDVINNKYEEDYENTRFIGPVKDKGGNFLLL